MRRFVKLGLISCFIIVTFLAASIIFDTAPVYSDDSNPFEKPILMGRTALPKLPRNLRRSMARGIIMIKVEVNDRGIVTGVEPIRSTGNDNLDIFIEGWVHEWTFIPKIVDEDSIDSFTILSIRYDLSKNMFEAPLPLETSAQIPAAVILKMSSQETTEVNNRLVSLEPLTLPAIPLNIQNLNASGSTRLLLDLDSTGKVIDVKNALEKPINPELLAWLREYLTTTSWKLTDGTFQQHNRIELPLEYNTSICKFSFGRAVYVKTNS